RDRTCRRVEEETRTRSLMFHHGKVVFDDDDTWNDLEETAVDPHHDTSGVGPVSDATANPVSAPERTLLRKVAVSKAVEPDKGTVVGSANLDLDPPPPVSQLMTRLFPSLKPKTQNASLPPPGWEFFFFFFPMGPHENQKILRRAGPKG
uniref:Uncharacterized protein n=1 Tax=Echeneis naucrates TaxID=173247 RepID=A0A665V3I4_ECHNA